MYMYTYIRMCTYRKREKEKKKYENKNINEREREIVYIERRNPPSPPEKNPWKSALIAPVYTLAYRTRSFLLAPPSHPSVLSRYNVVFTRFIAWITWRIVRLRIREPENTPGKAVRIGKFKWHVVVSRSKNVYTDDGELEASRILDSRKSVQSSYGEFVRKMREWKKTLLFEEKTISLEPEKSCGTKEPPDRYNAIGLPSNKVSQTRKFPNGFGFRRQR